MDISSQECTAALALPLRLIYDEGNISNHCLKVHCTKGQDCDTMPEMR
jgi:hypothetical protein